MVQHQPHAFYINNLKISFYSQANKTYFYIKGRAPNLAFVARQKATRKLPIIRYLTLIFSDFQCISFAAEVAGSNPGRDEHSGFENTQDKDAAFAMISANG